MLFDILPVVVVNPVVFNAFTRAGGHWNDMLLSSSISSRRRTALTASALALMIDIYREGFLALQMAWKLRCPGLVCLQVSCHHGACHRGCQVRGWEEFLGRG